MDNDAIAKAWANKSPVGSQGWTDRGRSTAAVTQQELYLKETSRDIRELREHLRMVEAKLDMTLQQAGFDKMVMMEHIRSIENLLKRPEVRKQLDQVIEANELDEVLPHAERM